MNRGYKKQSQPLRIENPDHWSFASSRTIRSELWFVNNKKLDVAERIDLRSACCPDSSNDKNFEVSVALQAKCISLDSARSWVKKMRILHSDLSHSCA